MIPLPFGVLPSGEPVEAYILTNRIGASARILTYGGIVTSLCVPDRDGQIGDVVLGFDRLEHYVADRSYFGAIIGRIAGRLSGGHFSLNGRSHPLARNDGPNHLHGGRIGFNRRIWAAQPLSRPDSAASLRLTYRSPDGEEGYPGNLDVTVTYTLTAACALVIETEAVTDQLTPLSLTHHSYFNLTGEGRGTIEEHELQIFAESFVPVLDDAMTCSGRREPVAGRGVDFRQPRQLRHALPQLFKSHGDLYVLGESSLPIAARVVEPRSGRVLEVSTDHGCLQFYSGVALDDHLVGKSGRLYGRHAGLCLECQGYPDGASVPDFGDILVHPGRPQFRRTTYAFSTN